MHFSLFRAARQDPIDPEEIYRQLMVQTRKREESGSASRAHGVSTRKEQSSRILVQKKQSTIRSPPPELIFLQNRS